MVLIIMSVQKKCEVLNIHKLFLNETFQEEDRHFAGFVDSQASDLLYFFSILKTPSLSLQIITEISLYSHNFSS